MTDITDSSTIDTAPKLHAAEPVDDTHHLPDPLPEAEIVQPAETLTLGEAMIIADIAVPAEPPPPKVFPYDLESPELGRAFLHARTPAPGPTGRWMRKHSAISTIS